MRLQANEVSPVGNTSEQFAQKIRTELVKWADVAKAAHIQVQQ
jgi:tripartite-type tricarboxylate transporter receptor subunit TctC